MQALRYALVAALFVVLAGSSFAAQTGPSIVGNWEMVDDASQKTIGFTFKADGTAVLKDGPNTMGDDKEQGVIKYKVDYTAKPIAIDLTIVKKGQAIPLNKMIAKFDGANKLHLCGSKDGERPTEFVPEDTRVFDRK